MLNGLINDTTATFMDVGIAIITVLASIGAVLLTFYLKEKSTTKSNRIRPSISIWTNKTDDIRDKLTIKETRWFMTEKELDWIGDKAKDLVFFYVRSIDNAKMNECIVKISIIQKNQMNRKGRLDYEWKIGRLSRERMAVCPLYIEEFYGKESIGIYFEMLYISDSHEQLKYTVNCHYTKDGIIQQRQDKLYKRKRTGIIKKKRLKSERQSTYRLLEEYNRDIADSFIGSDILKKIEK